MVAYPPGDDFTADTRYRIDPASGEPADFEFRGFFGPAWGTGVVFFGGVGGIAVWLALVASVVVRAMRGRRRRVVRA